MFKSSPKFLDGLKVGFADPDHYATAEREIKKLTQASLYSSYYSRLVTLIAQLGWTEEAVKIHYFRRGLKEETKDILVGRDLPNLTTKFVSLCIKLDNQIEARSREKQISKKRAPITSFILLPPPFLKQNQFPVSVQNFKTVTSYSTPSHATEDPMDLDSASRKAYRKANNLCTYCGAPGYWVKSCPKLKSKDNKITNANVGNSVIYEVKNFEN